MYVEARDEKEKSEENPEKKKSKFKWCMDCIPMIFEISNCWQLTDKKLDAKYKIYRSKFLILLLCFQWLINSAVL